MKYYNIIPELFFARTSDMPLLEFNPDLIAPSQR